jgi:hypothetical protein
MPPGVVLDTAPTGHAPASMGSAFIQPAGVLAISSSATLKKRRRRLVNRRARTNLNVECWRQ